MSAALKIQPPTLKERLDRLEKLIGTTPPGSPSVIMELTPELAKHIVTNRNTDNRPKRDAKITQYAEDLLNGNFPLTGDTIKFSDDGRLLDGQNRLWAIIRSGVTLWTHVVFGLDFDVFHYLDGGAGRTAADAFAIHHVYNHAVTAKASRWLMIFDKTTKHARGSLFPTPRVWAYYNGPHVNRSALEAQVRRVQQIDRTLPPAQLAALLYLFEQRDPAINLILVNDLLHRRRGARVLLEEMQRLRRHAGNRVHESIVAAMIILTWKAYRSGKMPKPGDIRWLDENTCPEIE